MTKHTLSHLMQFAGTSRHNPAILNATLIGDGLGELAAEGLLIIKTSTGEAWITQDGLEALGLPVLGNEEDRRLERFIGQVMDGVLFDPETMAQVKSESAERSNKRLEERRKKILERNRRNR